jgi:hypothetical protein
MKKQTARTEDKDWQNPRDGWSTEDAHDNRRHLQQRHDAPLMHTYTNTHAHKKRREPFTQPARRLATASLLRTSNARGDG